MSKITFSSIALFMALVVPVAAGSHSSSSSSSSSSRSSSSSSSSYSKPSAAPTYRPPSPPPTTYSKPSAPVPVASSSNSGYTKPSPPSPPIATYTKPATPNTPAATVQAPKPVGALGAASSRSMSSSSLAAYQAERSRAQNPPQPVNKTAFRNDTAFTSTKSQYGSVNGYMENRTRDVNVYHSRYPDVVVYNRGMSSNYGHFDSSFLMGLMLGHLGSNASSNAAWMYSRQNDPWYPQWRADMQKQAEQNGELKTKLAAMDAELAQLKAQNAKPTTDALPAGVSGSIAIAPEAMIEDDDEEETSHFWLWALLGIFVIGGGAAAYFNHVGKSSRYRMA